MTFVSRLRDAWSLQPPGSHITDPSGTLSQGTRCDEWASTPREMLSIPILHSLFRHLVMSQL